MFNILYCHGAFVKTEKLGDMGTLLLTQLQNPTHIAFSCPVSPGTSGLPVAQSFLALHDLNSLEE